MATAFLVARLLLAGVLGVAGLSKLRERQATETAARELGLDARVARIVGIALAPVELLLAALLLPGVTAWPASAAAFVLLLAFTAVIATSLRRGNRPACACFGAASDEPISAATLVRNTALVVLAGFAVAREPGPTEGAVAGLADRMADAGAPATLAGLGLLVGAQAVATIALYARRPAAAAAPGYDHAPLAEAGVGAGWPPGTVAPGFTLESVEGLRVSLADLLRREKPVLLVFTEPGCAPCNALLPEVADWQDTYGDILTVALIGSGTVDDNRGKQQTLGLRDVLVQGDDEVAAGYRYNGTPGAVLIGRDGRIATRISSGPGPIRSLLAATVTDLDPPETIETASPRRLPPQIPVGEPTPPIRLPALAGHEVDLAEFLGRMVVLLFWRPTCGFCQQIRDDVQRWEEQEAGVQLVLVSSGGVPGNERQGFASPVLLEDDRATLTAYGAPGTPSAVLIDANGNVASPLAVGGEDVLALLARAATLGRVVARTTGLTTPGGAT